jgi:hypothetical protein
MTTAGPDSANTASTQPKATFWNGVDAKFLCATLLGLVGLFGPIKSVIDSEYKQRLADQQTVHQQRMDLIDKLLKAQELDDERQRVLARRDILSLMHVTFGNLYGIDAFVTAEQASADQQLKALLSLQVEEVEATIHGKVASSLPKASDRLVDAKRKVAETVLVTSSTKAPTTIEVRTENRVECTEVRARAPGASLSSADAAAICRELDLGARSWLAQAKGQYINCECLGR